MIEITPEFAQEICNYISANPSPNAIVGDAVNILLELQKAAVAADAESKEQSNGKQNDK